MKVGPGNRFSFTGKLGSQDVELIGTLESARQESSRFGRTMTALGHPFVLFIFSGLGLTMLTQCIETRRLEVERRVSDVRLVREMLPQMVKSDSEGIAAKRLLAYLGDRTGADQELVKVVQAALSPPPTAKGEQRAKQVEASAIALGEQASIGAPPSGAPPAAGTDRPQPGQRDLLHDTVLPDRAYIQIATEEQRACASLLQNGLREAGIGAPGIELVGRQAPTVDQIRFFHPEDRAQADLVGQLFEKSCGRKPLSLPVSGLANPSNRNLIEVWARRQPAVSASGVPAAAFCYQEEDAAKAEAQRFSVHCHATTAACEVARGPNARTRQTGCVAVQLTGVQWQPQRGFGGSWYQFAPTSFGAPFPPFG